MTTEDFNLLSKNEKKTLIAQDVLDNLESKKYRARSGSYIQITLGNLKWDDNVKEHFNDIEECQVCALGASLMSLIHFINSATFVQIDGIGSRNPLWSHISEIFDIDEIELIERCFEGSRTFIDTIAVSRFRKEENENIRMIGGEYADTYPSADDRLKAIMENILRNEGTFIPQQDIKP